MNEELSLKRPQWTVKACQKMLLGVALAASSVAPVFAEEQPGANLRWFEIEVIAFQQEPQRHADSEYFALPLQAIPLQRHVDLLTAQRREELLPALQMIPSCAETEEPESDRTDHRFTEKNNRPHWFDVIQQLRQLNEPAFISSQRLNRPLCRETMLEQLLAGDYVSPRTLPADTWATAVTVDGQGGEMLNTDEPFLLPADSLELNDLKRQLERQSGKELLLHTAWRQPVFNRNQGTKMRLYGGRNYSPFYDYLGFTREQSISPTEYEGPATDPNRLLAQQQAPLHRIQGLLNQIDQGQQPFSRPDVQAAGLPDKPSQYPANLPNDVWQFDGLMHIYLVGNYLHIDGEFNLREEIQVPLQATSLEAQAEAALREQRAEADFLRGYYFNQLRRVISHETHYFDHPNFGIIVQIRRTDLSGRR